MKYGQIAKVWGFGELPLRVLQSNAGWYIGTWDNEGPVSRESECYYRTQEEAQKALDTNTWTQKNNY